jgi:ADP-heptose:LPS heptosyltransferase
VNTIVIRRTGALGDVVLTTPVVRHLRTLHPDANIMVQTAYPDVFANSPYGVVILSPDTPVPPAVKLIPLDLAYERRPMMHIVDAYSEALETYDFPPIPADQRLQKMYPPEILPKTETTIAVHAARSWVSRTLPMSFWLDVAGRLRAAKVTLMFLGTDRDMMSGMYCNLPLMDTAAHLSRCDAFVGSDSSLLHVAAAVGCPVVGLFTSVRPRYRMPIGGPGVAFVAADLDCVGCLERAPVPTTNLTVCERGDHACVWRFDPTAVVATVLSLARNKTDG